MKLSEAFVTPAYETGIIACVNSLVYLGCLVLIGEEQMCICVKSPILEVSGSLCWR